MVLQTERRFRIKHLAVSASTAVGLSGAVLAEVRATVLDEEARIRSPRAVAASTIARKWSTAAAR